ncbi:penicillin-insensitive murein endopeptidase [Streptomyces sp. NPDC047117]|uniref:penicillin-insensitive murein endopeptidase n=1 Tax=Streptomyces sp. NPDC047117 TaxID=3155379 RepID=UPI003401EE53
MTAVPPVALQQSTEEVASTALARKVERNRQYAASLGWGAHLPALRRALNPKRTGWDDAALVTEAAKWQARTGLAADGLIGPATWSLLRVAAGLGKDPAISAQLPDNGPGFYGTGPADRRYGRAETVRALQAVAAAWQQARPRGPRIGIGDIGLRGGGPITGHGSHRLGLDVDIRPLRDDGREAPVVQGHPGYSRALTQELVDRLRANGVLRVHFILFNDPGVRGVQRWDNHDNHLHVRFASPKAAPASQTAAPAAAVPVPQHAGGAAVRPAAAGTIALGTLTTLAPGPAGTAPPYRFSPEDLLWTARFIIGESGGRDDLETHAVLYAMFNRYALLTRRHYATFEAFLRAYSTPLQQVLKDWRAARRHMHRPDYVRTGDTYKAPAPPGIPRGQLRGFHRLQQSRWDQLPDAARSAAFRALTGAIPNPIGNATEFGSTWQYFRDAHRRSPNLAEWQQYTVALAQRKGWSWIGPVPGIDQTKNAFFTDRRLAGLPRGAVRILPP